MFRMTHAHKIHLDRRPGLPDQTPRTEGALGHGRGHPRPVPLVRHRARTPPQRQIVAPPEDPARPPLPAGHPRTWDMLTAGTVLESTPYPLPVFPR
jgi:hypothetical protein